MNHWTSRISIVRLAIIEEDEARTKKPFKSMRRPCNRSSWCHRWPASSSSDSGGGISSPGWESVTSVEIHMHGGKDPLHFYQRSWEVLHFSIKCFYDFSVNFMISAHFGLHIPPIKLGEGTWSSGVFRLIYLGGLLEIYWGWASYLISGFLEKLYALNKKNYISRKAPGW